MLLVIVGAGASFDCLTQRDVQSWGYYKDRLRPPLAGQLFEPRDEFTKRMPTELRGLAVSLRAAMAEGAGLEDQLEEIVRRADDRSFRELMALRFYLRDIITWCEAQVRQQGVGGNAYDALARVLGRWSSDTGAGICYATFNYDRLLEQAIRASGGPAMEDLDSYVADAQVRLYKLHGSVRWVRLGDVPGVPSDRAVAIPGAPSLELGPVVMAPANQERQQPVQVPAIAVPTVTKSGFECPDVHLDALRRDLADVNAILVAGWRGAEAHFLQMLSDHLGGRPVKVLVANGVLDDCTECLKALSRSIDKGGKICVQPMNRSDGKPLPFSSLVTSNSLAEFLGAI